MCLQTFIFVFCHSFCLSVLDITDSGDPDVSLCCCLSIRLSELLSVNVGLFDQYFRVVGRWIHTHTQLLSSVCRLQTSLNIQQLLSADVTPCPLLTSLWIDSVCRSFGRSHRVLPQQGQLWDERLSSGADVCSQSAAAASSSRAVRSGLLLPVYQHKHR